MLKVVVVVVVECVCWWMDVPLTTGGDREPGDMDQSLPHSPPVSLPATTSTRTLTAPHCPHHILLPHTTTTHHTAHTTSYYTPPHTTTNNSNILPFLFLSLPFPLWYHLVEDLTTPSYGLGTFCPLDTFPV